MYTEGIRLSEGEGEGVGVYTESIRLGEGVGVYMKSSCFSCFTFDFKWETERALE